MDEQTQLQNNDSINELENKRELTGVCILAGGCVRNQCTRAGRQGEQTD